MNSPKAIAALEVVFRTDEFWFMRRAALEGMAEIGGPKVLSVLLGEMIHNNNDLQQFAAYYLGRLGE